MYQPAKQLPWTTNREAMGGTSSTSRSARSGVQHDSTPVVSQAHSALVWRTAIRNRPPRAARGRADPTEQERCRDQAGREHRGTPKVLESPIGSADLRFGNRSGVRKPDGAARRLRFSDPPDDLGEGG